MTYATRNDARRDASDMLTSSTYSGDDFDRAVAVVTDLLWERQAGDTEAEAILESDDKFWQHIDNALDQA